MEERRKDYPQISKEISELKQEIRDLDKQIVKLNVQIESNVANNSYRLNKNEIAIVALEGLFHGNGKPGVITRLDRLEQVFKNLNYIWVAVCGSIGAALWALLTK